MMARGVVRVGFDPTTLAVSALPVLGSRRHPGERWRSSPQNARLCEFGYNLCCTAPFGNRGPRPSIAGQCADQPTNRRRSGKFRGPSVTARLTTAVSGNDWSRGL